VEALPAHSRTGSKIIDCQAPLIHCVSSSLCGWSLSRVPLTCRLVSRVRSVVCYPRCDNSRYIWVNVRFPREKLLTMTSASCTTTRGTVSLYLFIFFFFKTFGQSPLRLRWTLTWLQMRAVNYNIVTSRLHLTMKVALSVSLIARYNDK